MNVGPSESNHPLPPKTSLTPPFSNADAIADPFALDRVLTESLFLWRGMLFGDGRVQQDSGGSYMWVLSFMSWWLTPCRWSACSLCLHTAV